MRIEHVDGLKPAKCWKMGAVEDPHVVGVAHGDMRSESVGDLLRSGEFIPLHEIGLVIPAALPSRTIDENFSGAPVGSDLGIRWLAEIDRVDLDQILQPRRLRGVDEPRQSVRRRGGGPHADLELLVYHRCHDFLEASADKPKLRTRHVRATACVVLVVLDTQL